MIKTKVCFEIEFNEVNHFSLIFLPFIFCQFVVPSRAIVAHLLREFVEFPPAKAYLPLPISPRLSHR